MRKIAVILALIMTFCTAGCGGSSTDSSDNSEPTSAESEFIPPESTTEEVPVISSEPYTRDTRISDVINDPVFGDYGRLIFPVDDGYYNGEMLGDLRLTWYNNIKISKILL